MSQTRPYREEIICLLCNKKVQKDNKPEHDKRFHKEKLEAKEKIPSKRLAPLGSQNIDTFFCKKPKIILDGKIDVNDTKVPSEQGQKNENQTEITSDVAVEETSQIEAIASSSKRNDNTPTIKVPNQPILQSYPFTKVASKYRKFNIQWYKSYPWIEYSINEDQVTCFACSEFGRTDSKKCIFKQRSHLEYLKSHSETKDHMDCMTKWLNHNHMIKQGKSALSLIESQNLKENIEKRNLLKKIIKTIMFCIQQNIALRGCVENRDNLAEMSNINRGNFLELISFQCRDDVEFKLAIEKGVLQRQQWLSPNIQNELIDLIAERVFARISERIKRAKFFGIIADETSDISKREQVSICFRFLLDGVIDERFFGFYDTISTTGEAITNLICDVVKDHGFDFNNLVGLGFDGASAMKSEVKGVAGLMKEKAPNAIFVHSNAHRLNLTLQKTLNRSQHYGIL